MSELDEILTNINKAVEDYENVKLENTLEQSEILRSLTSNLFYLEKFRSDAHNDWLEVYYNCPQKTNAGKERWADKMIKELYMYRRLMTSGYKVVDSLRSTISIHRKEN